MTENIGKVLTGLEFKQLYKTEFYKILKNNLIHYDHQYIDGINICLEEFNPNGECSSGGLYFVEFNKISLWLNYTKELKYIVKVDILDDSLIYVEKNKFKANKFLIDLSKKYEINDFLRFTNFCKLNDEQFMNEEICRNMIQKNAMNLSSIPFKFRTKELCELAIKKDSHAISCINTKLIKGEPTSLNHLSNEQIEEVCKLVIMKEPSFLQHIIDQTEELCMLAIKKNGHALQFVKPEFMTEKICKLAVQQNSNALKYVPSKFMTEEIRNIAENKDCLEKLLTYSILTFIVIKCIF